MTEEQLDAWEAMTQVSGDQKPELAEWVAAARIAMPLLIAEVRRLRVKQDKLKNAVANVLEAYAFVDHPRFILHMQTLEPILKDAMQ